jgi:predicted outer membrane repeat protein
VTDPASARTLKISTTPNSPLSSPADQRKQIATANSNKTTTWCVPCGQYTFTSATTGANTYLPGNSFIKLTIPRSTKEDDDLVLIDSTDYPTKASKQVMRRTIRLPCAEQAVTLSHAHFQHNQAAQNGGAMSTPDNYKNALFLLRNITFHNNIANKGKGGAVRISGTQTALDISQATFTNNQATSGGALSIDSSASMQLSQTTASKNNAIGGDGGFLFSRFALPLLLRDVNIQQSTTDQNGGGGGMAVYSTSIALQNVTVQHCQAGKKGGGGVLLDLQTAMLLCERAAR